ncbi:unnamed protein product [Prunus armeniaca]|uniref:Large ribosomal subunit protein uL2 C-terminal domain-containing protein n=1 Tax=Prunus armeniaca TaxID=36596 RepID=A0A6J5V0C0_PRUAR|nr:unnamed protein product [Prunus armeniaca]CAB4309969.1 unnamed protein product [Prunus armeniaca]
MPLGAKHIGAKIHNIEMRPGQGGKLVRAPRTHPTILKEPSSAGCLVKLPSHVQKWIDSKCRATIGSVSKWAKFRKSAQEALQGRAKPVVGPPAQGSGSAMNPIDHPHGGG